MTKGRNLGEKARQSAEWEEKRDRARGRDKNTEGFRERRRNKLRENSSIGKEKEREKKKNQGGAREDRAGGGRSSINTRGNQGEARSIHKTGEP